MEDKLTWADTVSAYALHDAGVDDRILEMWGELRKATIFFMRYQHGQHKEEYIAEAQTALFRYTAMVQDTFGMNELMTFQLHTCMAHAADQARMCGPTAFAGEWWLERCMQVFKRITKYRSTRHPECVGTNHFLAVQALGSVPCCRPWATKLFHLISPAEGRVGGRIRDDTSGDEWLVGPLQDLSNDVNAVCMLCLCFSAPVRCLPTTVMLPDNVGAEYFGDGLCAPEGEGGRCHMCVESCV